MSHSVALLHGFGESVGEKGMEAPKMETKRASSLDLGRDGPSIVASRSVCFRLYTRMK